MRSGKRKGWNPPPIPEGTDCSYCEGIATGWDHIVPWSWKPGGPITPACGTCNSILSNKVFNTFAARKRYVRRRLAERARIRSRRVSPPALATRPAPEVIKGAEATCYECGKLYQKKKSFQKFCTTACADKNRKRRQAEGIGENVRPGIATNVRSTARLSIGVSEPEED